MNKENININKIKILLRFLKEYKIYNKYIFNFNKLNAKKFRCHLYCPWYIKETEMLISNKCTKKCKCNNLISFICQFYDEYLFASSFFWEKSNEQEEFWSSISKKWKKIFN